MTGSVLVLGGYGNFGRRIARVLVMRYDVPVIINGRDPKKANAFAASLSSPLASVAIFDAKAELAEQLQRLRPAVVVNTCGPFQASDYSIAHICIRQGVHYIDLADARDFVTGITALDAQARAAGVSVVSGASTVPGLSSAVVEHFRHEFTSIDSMDFGISPGQKAERGYATTKGIMSYVGKKLKPFAGADHPVYGWQDSHRQLYPELGKRWMARCDVPDLDLLPAEYGIRSIRFSAGLELGALHLGLAALGWLVKRGVPLTLPRWSGLLLKLSNAFNVFGSANGGMHVILRGTGADGQPHARSWFIIARDGDGPQIPCVPAIVLARNIAAGKTPAPGARACMGLVTLNEYIEALRIFHITTYEYAS